MTKLVEFKKQSALVNFQTYVVRVNRIEHRITHFKSGDIKGNIKNTPAYLGNGQLAQVLVYGDELTEKDWLKIGKRNQDATHEDEIMDTKLWLSSFSPFLVNNMSVAMDDILLVTEMYSGPSKEILSVVNCTTRQSCDKTEAKSLNDFLRTLNFETIFMQQERYWKWNAIMTGFIGLLTGLIWVGNYTLQNVIMTLTVAALIGAFTATGLRNTLSYWMIKRSCLKLVNKLSTMAEHHAREFYESHAELRELVERSIERRTAVESTGNCAQASGERKRKITEEYQNRNLSSTEYKFELYKTNYGY